MAIPTPMDEKTSKEFRKLFQLPQHWTAEISHFAFNEVRDGTHDSPKEYSGKGYPLITSKNLKAYGLDFSKVKNISPEDHSEISKRSKVETGDILFSMIGTIGNVSLVEEKTAFSIKNVGLFRNNRTLINEYFGCYWLRSNTFQTWLTSKERGGTQKFVSLGVLRTSPIVIPPLAEQKRIVEKLDSLLAQVDTIGQRLNNLPNIIKRFRQSVLAAAVSGKLTEQWREDIECKPAKCVLLEELLKDKKQLSYGVLKPGDEDSEGVPMIRVMDLAHDGKIQKAKIFKISKSLSEQYKRTILEEGDIILAVMATIGRAAIVPADLSGSNVNRALAVIKLNESICPKYFLYQLMSPLFQNEFVNQKLGTAQKRINLSGLRLFNVILPQREEQTEIVRLVEQHFALADTLEKNLKNAKQRVDNLTQSILAKAFRGELVPQDPNDEPAEQLLARIKAARAEAELLEKAAKKVTSKTKRQKGVVS
jgi:type I restriction enzyme S subunit